LTKRNNKKEKVMIFRQVGDTGEKMNSLKKKKKKKD